MPRPTAAQLDSIILHGETKQDASNPNTTALLHPFSTLSSHTHRTPIAISPLSHTLYSPSKYTYSRFGLPRLNLLDKGPELGDESRGVITMLKVREVQKGQETCYVAIHNTLYITKGNILLRRIIAREPIIAFCWIGALICLVGERHVTVLHEKEAREVAMEMKDEEMHEEQDGEGASQEQTHMQYYTKYISRVPLPHDSTPTDVVHLPTYLNKVLITTQQGHIDLFNVMNGTLVHRFGPFERKQDYGNLDASSLHILSERRDANRSLHASITCMVPVPDTLDVVALGLSDGQILVHDMYTDETLLTFDHSPGPVRAISFRADDVPTMVSGSDSGSVAVWSLVTGKLLQMYPQAHTDSIISLTFIAGTSLMVSSGEDNSIKLWEFETPEKMNLTFSAEGHALPPSKVRFYGPSGKWVISAGKDRQIRITDIKSGHSTSFKHTQHANELIRGDTANKKRRTVAAETTTSVQELTEALRPPIIDFDYCFLRERDWPNLVTAHANDRTISTWIIRDATQGKGTMYGQRYDAPATTTAVSPCGNHVIIGRKDGSLEKWNLQSCLKKGDFRRGTENDTNEDKSAPVLNKNQEAHNQKKRKVKSTSSSTQPAHDTSINAAIVDHMNQYVFSGGFDGVLRVWSLANLALVHEENFGKPISKIIRSRNSSMIALAFADFSIRILDANSFKVIRHFRGHTFVVNDMAFSSDSRFLYSCANDNYLIVWDIISSDKVEWIELPQPATSVDVDTKDMYVITSHAGSVGLSMWINKLTFGAGTLRRADEPVRVSLPQMGDSFHFDNLSINEHNSKVLDYNPDEPYEYNPAPMSDTDFSQLLKRYQNQFGLVTQLGSEGEQKVLSIRRLDVLRERAKVFDAKDVDALKEHIPFFIETEATELLETKFVSDEMLPAGRNLPKFDEEGKLIRSSEPKTTDKKGKEIVRSSIRGLRGETRCTSRLIEVIIDCAIKNWFEEAEKYIQDTSPKVLEMSVRLLSAMDNYKEMLYFLGFIRHMLRRGIMFDLVQSLLNLFLQVHDEVLIMGMDNPELVEMLQDIHHLQQDGWQRIDQKLKQNVFLCKHLSNLQ